MARNDMPPISATVGGLAATRDRWVRLPARSFVLMLYSKMHRFQARGVGQTARQVDCSIA